MKLLFRSTAAVAMMPSGDVAIKGVSAIDGTYIAVIMTKNAARQLVWRFETTVPAQLSDHLQFTKRTASGGTITVSKMSSLLAGTFRSHKVDLNTVQHILLVGTNEDLNTESFDAGDDLVLTACGSAPDLFLSNIYDRSQTDGIVRFATWRQFAEKLIVNNRFDAARKLYSRSTATMQAAGTE